ncbi:MAG: polyprenyl synthetase family protein [Lachnospiraceae bacterium]|nr:polyprenyl synthetase family protein [Candidatus Equihabitans merdae]
MDAFMTFYKASFDRLNEQLKVYNRQLRREEKRLLAPARKDMADLNSGGKLLRGVLVNLGYRLAGYEDVSYSDAAAIAFEIFQTGILIHDDIIDKAKLRRGKKTMTERYIDALAMRDIDPPAEGETRESVAAGMALCAGDYMITEANLHLLENYAGKPHGAEAIKEFDRIVLDTIRGEMLDVILPCEAQDATPVPEEADRVLEESIMDIYHLKTSRYSVMGPMRVGMILGGMTEKRMAIIDEIMDEFGIAFQIKDDLLGIYADAEKLGKEIGSDVSEFKQTILYAYVKRKNPDAYEELLKYYGKADLTAEDIKAVQEIFSDSGAKRYAEKKMEQGFERALERLEKVKFISEDHKEILKDFIQYSRHREK